MLQRRRLSNREGTLVHGTGEQVVEMVVSAGRIAKLDLVGHIRIHTDILS